MVKRVQQLLGFSLAVSTRKVYRRAWALFKEAMCNTTTPFLGLESLPASINQIMYFIGYLNLLKLSPSTITSYTSALGYAHRAKGWTDPTKNPVVQKMLAAANKLKSQADARLPITLVILVDLVKSLDHTVSNLYHRILFQAMYTIAFFGLMRVGEITKTISGIVPLQLKNLKIYTTHITLTISHFKHNTTMKPFTLVLPRQSLAAVCPVTVMVQYLKVRGPQEGPLFCFPDGGAIPRNFFIKHLKNCFSFCGLDVTLYKSHSFRIGGASFYASLGLSDAQIRTLGRWNSDAFLKYIREQRILMAIAR